MDENTSSQSDANAVITEQNVDSNVTVQSVQKHKFAPILIGLLVLLVIGLVGLLYAKEIGPFSRATYTEDNLMEGLLSASSNMRTGSYKITGAFTVEPRDKDAQPFEVITKDDPETLGKYERDSTRGESVTALLFTLNDYFYQNNSYPESLNVLINKNSDSYYTIDQATVLDPLSQRPYEYRRSGNNFSLIVTFETADAITEVNRSADYATTPAVVNGQTVTFTADSYGYMYLSSKPPLTFFESLKEMVSMVPPELAVNSSLGVRGDWGSKDSAAAWEAVADATGDLGDLSYKVNIEARKKDKSYYVRINNLPSLFGLPVQKGQWYDMTPSDANADDYGFINTKDIAEFERESAEFRYKLSKSLRTVAKIADSTGLFGFKNDPKKVSVDGRSLYEYKLYLRADSVKPFYEALVKESKENPDFLPGVWTEDAIGDKFESEEFRMALDYFNENTTVTIMTDSNGLPARLEYKLRIVPPDSVVNLADKQLNIVFRIDLDDINKSVTIEKPGDTKPLKELFDDMGQSSVMY